MAGEPGPLPHDRLPRFQPQLTAFAIGQMRRDVVGVLSTRDRRFGGPERLALEGFIQLIVRSTQTGEDLFRLPPRPGTRALI